MTQLMSTAGAIDAVRVDCCIDRYVVLQATQGDGVDRTETRRTSDRLKKCLSAAGRQFVVVKLSRGDWYDSH